MPYAENKPLIEYGDLASMHHTDRQAAEQAGERELEIQNQPAFLMYELQLGGSYVIKWSKGEEEVPFECLGLFTGSSQAGAAIKLAMTRLTAEAAQREQDALDASFEEAAVADVAAALEAKEQEIEEAKAPVKKTAVKKTARKKSA